MARRRKDYRVEKSPDRLIGEPDTLTVRFFDGRGHPRKSFDFSRYASHSRMAGELSLAFRHHHASLAPETCDGAFQALVYWFDFLDAYEHCVRTTADVDSATLRAFIAWLDQRLPSKGSRYTVWSAVKQLLVWLQRHRPELTHPEMDIPFNPFPRKNAEMQSRPILERSEMEAVLAAARSDIETSWAMFCEGQKALEAVDRAAISAERDLKKLDLDDFGTFIAVIVERFGGFVPSQRVIYRENLWPILFALQRHGYAYVTCYLHPVPETLIPFMIAIGAQTYANPQALLDLRRDCMSEHLLLDRRVVVSWAKGRTSREQRRSFLRDRSMSVPNLIDRLLSMTERLVPHTKPEDRNRLFLYATLNKDPREVKGFPAYLAAANVRRFVKRHGLKGWSGKPLALTLASLRATGLTLAHESLGFDIFKTQALANHATPDTTQRYVDRPRVRRAQAAALGELQARFVEVVREGGEEDPREEPVPDIDARHATAAGFICRDPLEGIAEGQTPGRLCTAWLGCFTCPNAVIPLDVGILARLLRTREAIMAARATMAPERWQLLYAPKVEIIDRDIVPRFPTDLQAAAQEQSAVLPSPPPVE